MVRTIIIGYGNPDRQDDGAAWHVLSRLAGKLEYEVPSSFEEGLSPRGDNPDLYFTLQLTPELEETLSQYERVCFVDVHTGSIPVDIQLTSIQPIIQNSPFTHHMTPATLLALTQHIHNKSPNTTLVSIRGYEFGFDNLLSKKTSILVDEAVAKLWKWLQEGRAEYLAGSGKK